MNKKIIFFDGDGTLWYPKTTKRTEKPYWVYRDEQTKDNYLKHLTPTPHVKRVLKVLRSHNIICVILSTHPQETEVATAILKEKVVHFRLDKYFDEIHATADYPEAKGEEIVKIIQRLGLTTEDALMVGDSYRWDYMPARSVGVEAILIDSDYHQEKKAKEPVKYLIDELDELISLLA